MLLLLMMRMMMMMDNDDDHHPGIDDERNDTDKGDETTPKLLRLATILVHQTFCHVEEQNRKMQDTSRC